jgi:hypothetical protein
MKINLKINTNSIWKQTERKVQAFVNRCKLKAKRVQTKSKTGAN